VEKLIKSYIRRLSNLSGNNRSLQLFKIIKEQFIDLHDFDFTNETPSFDTIKLLISRKKEIFICNELDSRDHQSNELGKRLRKISKKDKFLFEERGSKDLYVGWPFVKGKFLDNTVVRCPLIFFPVSLEKRNNEWWLHRREDVNVTLNKTFLLAYYYYNQIPINEELVETVIDGYERDSVVFRTQLYELLKKEGLEIHFNQDNFMDFLQPFKDLTKGKVDEEEKSGRLKLYPNAVLGIFPQSGSYLVPDYMKILEKNENENLEDFFYSKSGTLDNDLTSEKVLEETTFTPFPIDAYQEKALKKIKTGQSLVIQGPPGTGKSQLIANTICDFIARGKNVLMVCQKRVALDVVYDRLKKRGVHDFIALVHDFKNDRKPIYEQINNQISSIDEYKHLNSSIDAIQLERSYLKTGRRITQIEEELEEYRKLLYDTNECHKSIKELYLISNSDEEVLDLNLDYKYFTFDKYDKVIRLFNSYLSFYNRFEKQNHFWNNGPSFHELQTRDLFQIENILKEIPNFVEEIKKSSDKFSFRTIDFETAEHFSQKMVLIQQLRKGLDEGIVFKVYKQLHADRPNKDIPWLTRIEKIMMSCYRGEGIEKSIESKDIGRFQEVLESAISARQNAWSWLKWKFFSHEKTLLKRVMVANNLRQTKDDFEILVERIDNRLNYEDAISQILDNPWLHNFPYTFRKITIQDWFYWQKRGLNMYYVSLNIRTLNEYLPVSKLDKTNYLEKLDALTELALRIPEKITLWSKYFSTNQVRAIVLKKQDSDQLRKTLRKDFDALITFHQIKKSLSKEEENVLDKLISKNISIENSLKIFKNSLAITWIDHIEAKFPELRMVSSGLMENLAQELEEEIESKRRMSKEILLIKMREKTYEDIEFNRLNNRVTYRELDHQVTKKRMVWPIRRTISEYGEELFNLLPCWMCSPESASAIFPLKEQFDLVIFDEASQCFAERGIPAMYRGKQVVVAGDSKQLRPSDLYRIRWEEDTDDPELSNDSVLDVAAIHLEETSLSGHYRSKSLELIDFSNQHFYKNKLRLLPDLNWINSGEAPIKFIKCDGKWKDQKNEIEAKEVAEFFVKTLENFPEKEVGIVTFNFFQQELIEEIVDELAIEKGLSIPEGFFVKNIENVQGDEKDIIIFSVGYAPNESGVVKAHFGSLNVSGGENRLNVAFTRAREQIVLFSSILPNQLQVDESRNEGPKLLKKYLEFAWQVSSNKWQPSPFPQNNSQIDWYLSDKLSALDFPNTSLSLMKKLPFADLTITESDKYYGLLLTDDDSFYHAESIKQIYVYQKLNLSNKNWPYERIFSRQYWIDKEGVEEKIMKFFYKLKKAE